MSEDQKLERRLLTRFGEAIGDFGLIEAGDRIPRPPEWGGYVLTADRIELWAEQPGRLHDRVVWTRVEPSRWRAERLQP